MQRAFYKLLGNYNFEDVLAGTEAFLLSDTKGFPPAPGQILDSMMTLGILINGEEQSPEEAYTTLWDAVRRSGRDSVTEFNKLPPLIKKIVASPNQLKAWADDETGKFLAYKQAFTNAYKEMLLMERAKQKLEPMVSRLKVRNILVEKKEPKLVEAKKEPPLTEVKKDEPQAKPEIPRSKRSHQIIHDLIAEFEMDKKLRKSKGLI